MDETDMKILKVINKVSPKTFTSPVKVNEILRLDANLLGTRQATGPCHCEGHSIFHNG